MIYYGLIFRDINSDDFADAFEDWMEKHTPNLAYFLPSLSNKDKTVLLLGVEVIQAPKDNSIFAPVIFNQKCINVSDKIIEQLFLFIKKLNSRKDMKNYLQDSIPRFFVCREIFIANKESNDLNDQFEEWLEKAVYLQ